MKLDYDLMKKVGATHYYVDNEEELELYRVAGNTVKLYSKVNSWKRVTFDMEWLINNLKRVPEKTKPEHKYSKVTYEHAWEVAKALEEGVELFPSTTYLGGSSRITCPLEAIERWQFDDLYTRSEVETTWTEKFVKELDISQFTVSESKQDIVLHTMGYEWLLFGKDFVNKFKNAALKVEGDL